MKEIISQRKTVNGEIKDGKGILTADALIALKNEKAEIDRSIVPKKTVIRHCRSGIGSLRVFFKVT